MKQLDKLNQLTESHAALRPGKGLITAVVALSLAILLVNDFRRLAFPFLWKG